MTRSLICASVLLVAPLAHADANCARAHAECAAQQQACTVNRRPVRNGRDPNVACEQMAQARCEAAAACDRQVRAQQRRQRREMRREERASEAYQAGYAAGQASTPPPAPPPQSENDDEHPFWTGQDRSAHASAPADDPTWAPMPENDPPPPPQARKPPPAVEAAPPQPLSADEIDAVVHQTQDNLHVCLMESLGAEVPHLHVTLGFSIDPQGHATGLSVQGLEGLAPRAEIAACFTRVAGLWHFRAPPAEQQARASFDF